MGLFRRSAAAADVQVVTDSAQDDVELAQVRDAVVAGGDWRPAANLLSARTGDHDRRGAAAATLSEAATAPAPWLDAWLEEQPGDPGAQLVAGWAMVNRAWEARGGGWAEDTGEDAFARFFRLLDEALPLCHRAALSGGDDPTPWVPLLRLAIGRQEPREVFDDRWSELLRRDPHNRLGHIAGLQYLCEKWHGSHEEMYALARSATGPSWSVVLPLQAHAEYVLQEASKGVRAAYALGSFWKDPQVSADLDAGLVWATTTGPTHAYALHDLTVVGYCLTEAGRWSDAASVFAVTGPRAYEYPWYYNGDPAEEFAKAYRHAVKRAR